MKYLILGAGPAGLTFSNRIKQAGVTSFLVLERETEAGGLCRSVSFDGSCLDIGGGHFLDVCRPHVNEFIFRFMPKDEWNLFTRDSRIDFNGRLISSPIEANIWQMKTEDQVKYLKSIAIAGSNHNAEMPLEFVSWIYWKLGERIAEDYMIPYNQKIYGKELNKLGTYWLEKLPSVTFAEVLMSCLNRKAYGKQPGHTQFYYPKRYGYGEPWLRMAAEVEEHIEYEKRVVSIDFQTKTVKTADGDKYKADIIITTIPWTAFEDIVGMPDEITMSIRELCYSSIQTEYHPENFDTDAHWIYIPNLQLSYHRILVRHNFCQNSKGYWTETNCDRVGMDVHNNNFKHINQYAYPHNTIRKPEIMRSLLGWSKERGVHGLGRWGEHQHYNSDVTVELAIQLADKLNFIR